MRREIVGIFICIMMLATVLVIRTSEGEQQQSSAVKLDKNFMFKVLEDLALIIKNTTYGKDGEIWKGRGFATIGERYAKDLLYKWITNNTKNFDATIVKERVGNEHYGSR